jgi:hypothetical protein
VPGAEPTSRILFEHNVFERFGEACDFAERGRGGIMFQGAGVDITLRHNTAWNDYTTLSLTKPGSDNFVFADNLVTPGDYCVHCDGGAPAWNGGVGTHLRGRSRMEGNVLIRVGSDRARKTNPSMFPPENLWFGSFEDAGVDAAQHRLLPGSKAKGTATDGTDPGADVDAVMAATAGVRAEKP